MCQIDLRKRLYFVIIIIRTCRKARAIAHARINTRAIPNIRAFGGRQIAATNQALAG